MPRAAIVSLGGHVPDRVVTNEELTRYMDTSDSWIQERTGIRERRWVAEGTENSDLALAAARKALDAAGWKPADVEAIVYASLSSISQVLDESALEEQVKLLNRCLNEYPKGQIINIEITRLEVPGDAN